MSSTHTAHSKRRIFIICSFPAGHPCTASPPDCAARASSGTLEIEASRHSAASAVSAAGASVNGDNRTTMTAAAAAAAGPARLDAADGGGGGGNGSGRRSGGDVAGAEDAGPDVWRGMVQRMRRVDIHTDRPPLPKRTWAAATAARAWDALCFQWVRGVEFWGVRAQRSGVRVRTLGEVRNQKSGGTRAVCRAQWIMSHVLCAGHTSAPALHPPILLRLRMRLHLQKWILRELLRPQRRRRLCVK
eukprot:363784-Chlamydomonas_euryale.AAC.9